MSWLIAAVAYAAGVLADSSGWPDGALCFGLVATVALLCALERHAERGDDE